MKYLYLQEDFRPFHDSRVAQNILSKDWLINETRTWKGGEEHVRVMEYPSHHVIENEAITIVSRATSSTEVMRILVANDALRRMGFKSVHLFIPYLPYARQDRVMNLGESLSLKVFTDMINTCKFDVVSVLDPHSDVSMALLNNGNNLSELYYDYVRSVMTHIVLTESPKKGKIAVISPDGGAYKKIYKTCENILYKGDLVICNKHRDLETNEITGTTIGGNVKGKICVIIDDICDGGRTFAELGAALKEKGAEKVFLIVTHGIFSYGEDQIKGPIDHVWTTDSFRDIESDFITLVKLETLLN
jgi:ribose-phosphate pyrophosphokinase